MESKNSTDYQAQLCPSSGSSNTSRKGRSEAAAVNRIIRRASMSMPPLSKLVVSYTASNCSSSLLKTSETAEGIEQPGSTMEKEPEGLDDQEKTPNIPGYDGGAAPSTYATLTLPDATLRPPKAESADVESNRMSFSSLFSLGSAVSGGVANVSAPQSTASSTAGSVKGYVADHNNIMAGPSSPSLASAKGEASSAPTTATDPMYITTSSHRQKTTLMNPQRQHSQQTLNVAAKHLESWSATPLPRSDTRSRSRTQRRPSGSTAASSASPSNADRGKRCHGCHALNTFSFQHCPKTICVKKSTRSYIATSIFQDTKIHTITNLFAVQTPASGKLGVCALDSKARSKPSRNILTRLQKHGEFEVIVFGDKVILDEGMLERPMLDHLKLYAFSTRALFFRSLLMGLLYSSGKLAPLVSRTLHQTRRQAYLYVTTLVGNARIP